MDIKTQLNDTMKRGHEAHDEIRLRTVRMALAAVKQVEIDKRITLDDAAVIPLFTKGDQEIGARPLRKPKKRTAMI